MLAASTAGFVFINADEFKGLCQRPDEMTEWWYNSSLFLVSALELMALPRPEVEVCFTGEPELVRFMRHTSPIFKKLAEAGIEGAQQVCSAWRRVLRSGLLRERDMDERFKAVDRLNAGIDTAVAEALEAGRLRACALASCAARESHEQQYRQCAACRTVVYCCREHQLADWPAHKATCKAARKAQPSADAP